MFPVAPALVERQLEAMVQRAKLRDGDARHRRAQHATIDEQRLQDELREQANDEVRAAFLIDAIADKEKVEVTEAEIEKKLAEMARPATRACRASRPSYRKRVGSKR